MKGVPTDWNNIVTNYIWFDPRQFAFQNYKQGKLNDEFFTDLKSSWNINLGNRPFSEKPIKCFAYVIYGKDSNGVIKDKIDTNNNLDFSDETEFTPVFEWKQILQEEQDGIIDDYNITRYPTSFLIDPNGKIIAKNLRGEKLLDTLNYYTKKK